jgi:hypothetical protein
MASGTLASSAAKATALVATVARNVAAARR